MESLLPRSPVGVIAGNGSLPLEFARAAKEKGLKIVAVAHRGETDPYLEKLVDECVWIKVGKLGSLLSALQSMNVSSVAFVGGISRVKIFGGISPDFKTLALIARLGSVKDDIILRGIAEEIEKLGITVFGAQVLLDKSVPQAGCLTSRDLSPEERKDASLGYDAAKTIGRLDIGQTVVAFEGLITAVEAVEGTDSALLRAGELAHRRGGVVVKLCKPQQDLRFDLPTIGEKTIHAMAKGGLTALVVEAGKTMMLDPVAIVREANKTNIAIRVVEGVEEFR